MISLILNPRCAQLVPQIIACRHDRHIARLAACGNCGIFLHVPGIGVSQAVGKCLERHIVFPIDLTHSGRNFFFLTVDRDLVLIQRKRHFIGVFFNQKLRSMINMRTAVKAVTQCFHRDHEI